jgi:hypothetical protein
MQDVGQRIRRGHPLVKLMQVITTDSAVPKDPSRFITRTYIFGYYYSPSRIAAKLTIALDTWISLAVGIFHFVPIVILVAVIPKTGITQLFIDIPEG